MILSEKKEKLKKLFEPYVKIGDDDVNRFFNVSQLVTFEKNRILKDENSIDEYLRIVLDGIGGFFLCDKNGELKCIHFAFEDDLLSDYISFRFNKPTNLIIKAMTKVDALVISKANFNKYLSENPNAFIFLTIGLELILEDIFNRYIELLTMSATERYKALIKKRQDIIQQIDNKHIASYLGIAPQSLSRLKRGI